MKFACSKCGTIITNDLVENESAELCDKDGEALISLGVTLRNEDWGLGRWIINRNDLISTHVTEDTQRINGCCDLDGCDGPNLRCDECNSYVATARYDCWLPIHVILGLTETKIAEQDVDLNDSRRSYPDRRRIEHDEPSRPDRAESK